MNQANRLKLAHKIAKELGIKGSYPINHVREIVIKLDVRPRKDGFVPGWRIVLDEKTKEYTLVAPIT